MKKKIKIHPGKRKNTKIYNYEMTCNMGNFIVAIYKISPVIQLNFYLQDTCSNKIILKKNSQERITS